MAIQWFPGHMHKARKEVAKLLPQIDFVFELLDARIPYSSSNPMINRLCVGKQKLKILTKSDLADPDKTALWLNYFGQQDDTSAIAISTKEPQTINGLIGRSRKLLAEKVPRNRALNILIVGIPNVGKSTLINCLAGRTIAKTGNEPAVTKGQQRIKIDEETVLFDTPGMMWPKVENENSAYRLATTGAIKATAISNDDVAFFAADFMLNSYPERLIERYHLQQIPTTELEFLEAAGRNRGCLGGGGRVDLERISTLFLNDLRSGALGPLTLEIPDQIERESLEVARKAEEKAKSDAEKKEQRKQKAAKRRKKK